ncbi:hypothetical protein Dimus_030335 [Dionaea muscipula]
MLGLPGNYHVVYHVLLLCSPNQFGCPDATSVAALTVYSLDFFLVSLLGASGWWILNRLCSLVDFSCFWGIVFILGLYNCLDTSCFLRGCFLQTFLILELYCGKGSVLCFDDPVCFLFDHNTRFLTLILWGLSSLSCDQSND